MNMENNMKTLTVGTTNPAKVLQIRDALSPLQIKVEGVADKKMLPEVVEDGSNVQENARKKAVTYAKALGRTVFSMDNALFLDGLSPENQPGIHVRRIGGTLASNDDELLDHGITLVTSLGGRTNGYWEYGICIADPLGNVFETNIKTPRVFTSKRSEKMVQGYPLESIQIDPVTNKYISEMSTDEQAKFWQQTIGDKLCSFVGGIIEKI